MSPVVLAIVGGLIVFGLLAVIFVLFMSGSRTRGRLTAPTEAVAVQPPQPEATAQLGRGADPLPQVSEALEGTAFWDNVQLELLRAGLMLRPSEALIICLISSLVCLALGWLLTGQPLHGVLLGGLGLAAPYMYMKNRSAKRQASLTSQLPDALDMLGAALRSGYALTRGFQVVASQMHPPISEEFDRLLREVRVGISVSEALDSMLERSDSYDLELVIAAVQTQLTMGGNLAEVLDNIAGMIRERVRLQGEINAATSEGRMSASILVAMPIIMGVAISVINPSYMEPLFTEKLGLMMLGGAGLLMLAGIAIIHKMLDIDI
jgi:tight adherence protein B